MKLYFPSLDADKQTAINLFLGVTTDRAITQPPVRRGYQRWFDPKHLGPPYSLPLPNPDEFDSEDTSCADDGCGFTMKTIQDLIVSGTLGNGEASSKQVARFHSSPRGMTTSNSTDTLTSTIGKRTEALQHYIDTRGDFWVEYYRPIVFTSLGKHFAYAMNSTLKLAANAGLSVEMRAEVVGGVAPTGNGGYYGVFEPRGNAGGAPRRERSNSKVVSGMRRWMSAQGYAPSRWAVSASSAAMSRSVPHPRHRLHVLEEEESGESPLAKPRKRTRTKKSLPAPDSSEAVSLKLLNPNVNEKDREGYEAYVGQCEGQGMESWGPASYRSFWNGNAEKNVDMDEYIAAVSMRDTQDERAVYATMSSFVLAPLEDDMSREGFERYITGTGDWGEEW